MFEILPIADANSLNPLNWPAAPFLKLFAAMAFASLLLGWAARYCFPPAGHALVESDDLEDLEIALLANDGPIRFAVGGIAALTTESPERATTDGMEPEPTLALSPEPPPGASPLLGSLHRQLASLGACPLPDAIEAAAFMAQCDIEPRLKDRGLLVDRWWSTITPWVILAPLIATTCLTIARIAVGVSRQKEVGFLVIGLGVLVWLGLRFVARRPRRTRRGSEILRTARSDFKASGKLAMLGASRVEPRIAVLAVAVLGTGALVGTACAELHFAAQARKKSSGAGGYGAGGCGGDGGGGWGGCGGCD